MQSTGERDGLKSLSSKETVLTKELSCGLTLCQCEGPDVVSDIRDPRAAVARQGQLGGWHQLCPKGLQWLNIKSQRTVLCSGLCFSSPSFLGASLPSQRSMRQNTGGERCSRKSLCEPRLPPWQGGNCDGKLIKK